MVKNFLMLNFSSSSPSGFAKYPWLCMQLADFAGNSAADTLIKTIPVHFLLYFQNFSSIFKEIHKVKRLFHVTEISKHSFLLHYGIRKVYLPLLVWVYACLGTVTLC